VIVLVPVQLTAVPCQKSPVIGRVQVPRTKAWKKSSKENEENSKLMPPSLIISVWMMSLTMRSSRISFDFTVFFLVVMLCEVIRTSRVAPETGVEAHWASSAYRRFDRFVVAKVVMDVASWDRHNAPPGAHTD
jgi:hypothetical protein